MVERFQFLFSNKRHHYDIIAIVKDHYYNKILKSDWLSTALISALIGQCNRIVRRDDLLNSAQFYMTQRLNLHRYLNTVQLRNTRKTVTTK